MSLTTLVLSVADNKQILALRYAEWATSGPSLEADIAAAAMGLDDLGHSRVLSGCADALGGARDSAHATDPASYYNLPYFDEPWTEWGQFVAANAVLDSAFTLMIQSMVEGNEEVLRTRLRKMLQEERFHWLHARSWLREGVEPRFVEEAWQQALEWFGPDDGEVAQLQRDGVLQSGPAELRGQLAARLEMTQPQVGIDWSGWDPVRRRSRPGGIDRQTFDMLRGLAERRFMPAGTGAARTG